jgi:hypothetical protein
VNQKVTMAASDHSRGTAKANAARWARPREPDTSLGKRKAVQASRTPTPRAVVTNVHPAAPSATATHRQRVASKKAVAPGAPSDPVTAQCCHVENPEVAGLVINSSWYAERRGLADWRRTVVFHQGS